MTKPIKRILGLFSALPLAFSSLPALPNIAAADASMKDSGISYTETVETINNPGAGYTSSIWAVCKPGKTPTYSPTGSLMIFFIDIGGFSSGANGVTAEDKTYTPGTDYDLDDAFFDAWRQTFANCRKNGCMIALRFRYDANGKTNPEPASFEQVLRHVEQIKDSGILEEYKDIIAYVESGFVGAWGEQHSGLYTSTEYKAQLLDAMLKCVPSPIPVTVRTPNTFAEWYGIKRSELKDFYPEPGSDAARVGMYNDGYMGSDSDLGTFSDRADETEWLSHQTLTSYYGGEFSGNIEYAKKFDNYLPENAIPEMYKTHLSYINANIFTLYNDYTFGEAYDVDGVNNSAYYGQTVRQFVRDHLGYRFVLRKSELSESVPQGGELKLRFSVENTGFANPIPKQKAELLLERDGQYIRTEIDIDSNKWYSCTTADEALEIKLPDSFPTGDWNAYLKLSVGNNTVEQVGMRSVRFANENVWNGGIGANYLGTFTVSETENHGTDNRFFQIGTDDSITPSDSRMYTVKGHINLDGAVSFPEEWTDDMIIAENGETKLYMTADDKYFYFMSNVTGKAEAAVYNLRIENAETARSYWTYYAPGGYVYFNNGSHEGIMCRWTDDTVEFRVAFGDTMASQPGTKYDKVRIFVQDSANEWVVVSDVTSGECSVPSDFNVFSAAQDIRLDGDAQYPIRVESGLEGASYQWYKDGEAIDGADKPDYIVSGADGSGTYSVKVTSAAGIEKTAEICHVLEVAEAADDDKLLAGDANCDGKVTIADAVFIMQCNALPGRYVLTARGEKNADVAGNGDGITNADALEIQRFMLGFVTELTLSQK